MRVAALLAILLVPVCASGAATSEQRHPYVRHWKSSTFGKRSMGGVAVGAGVGTLRHSPRKWGGGAAGFGKRLGAGLGTHVAKTSVEHSVAAALHEDLHYHRSNKRGVVPRLKHALVSTVVTTNTKNGKRRPAAGRISGNAAAGAVSQGVFAGASGASTAGIGLGADAGANVAREFWPRHRRKGPAHRAKQRLAAQHRSAPSG
jgi:hypothetical protein